MAGVGAHFTKQVVELAHDAAAAGANYFLVLPPARCSSEPVTYSYNFPGVCNGIDIDSETITEILRESTAASSGGVSNVVGLKLTRSSVGKITRLVATFGPSEFAIFGDQSDFLIVGLAVGSAGCISAFANVFPKTASKVYELFTAGKLAEAMELQRSSALAETPCQGGVSSTKCAVALYSAPAAGIDNALERLRPRTPYVEVGDAIKKTTKELMGTL